jgi:hypothetical protein
MAEQADLREDRLAVALRANLLRRKQQIRSRDDAVQSPSSAETEAQPPMTSAEVSQDS